MAKRHLIELSSKLKHKYEAAEELYSCFALSTQDMIITDETMEPLKVIKSGVDTLLMNLSISIDAAFRGKIIPLIKVEERTSKAFTEPLLQLLENISKSPETQSLQQLLTAYNEKLRGSELRMAILTKAKFCGDLPNRKKKEKRHLGIARMTLDEAMMEDIFLKVDAEMERLSIAQKEFLAQPIISSTKGDLDE